MTTVNEPNKAATAWFTHFVILSYRWTPLAVRITIGLTCMSLLVCAGWVVGTLADIDNLIASDGVLIAAVVVVAVVPALSALLMKSYASVVYALRKSGAIPEGPLDPQGIRRELVTRAGLEPPPD